MSDQSDDLREEFTDTLDDAAAALGDGDLSAEETADLRERVERLADEVSESSVPDLLAAAGVDLDGDEDEASLADALAGSDSAGVDSLRKLLDVAELGEDAPADDREFTERLTAIVDADEASGGDGEGDGDEGGETVDEEDTDESAEEADDDQVTFADVFSGAASLAKDWSDSRSGVAEDEPRVDETDEEETPDADEETDVEDEESDDESEEDEDGLFDPEAIKERLSGDDEESDDGGRARRSRSGRYSTVPSRRSDMGKRRRRFSTVKGRK